MMSPSAGLTQLSMLISLYSLSDDEPEGDEANSGNPSQRESDKAGRRPVRRHDREGAVFTAYYRNPHITEIHIFFLASLLVRDRLGR